MPRWATATDAVTVTVTAGRGCASQWSDRFWPRRRPRDDCARSSSGCRNRTGSIPAAAGPVRFSASTIERWYYRARAAHQDPVGALRARPRTDAGTRAGDVGGACCDAARAVPRPSVVVGAAAPRQPARACRCRPRLWGRCRPYATLTRVMRSLGLVRHRRRRQGQRETERTAVEAREVLSYEVSRSHALWHADMHHGKRRGADPRPAEWKTPILLGFLDDHSRLGCHPPGGTSPRPPRSSSTGCARR